MKSKNKPTRWAILPRIAKPLVFAIAVFALSAIGATTNNASADIETWGPQDRSTFTWKEPADYVTFNSITDNPVLGDERNFVRIRKAGTQDNFIDEVTIEPGAEYEVLVWYHNNAKSRLNEDGGTGIAKNARLRLEIPENVPAGKAAAIKGIISADNAKPKEVWDLAFAKAEQGVALRFVPNSAVVHLNEPGTYNEAKGGWYDAKGYETAEGRIVGEDALFNRDGYGGAMLAFWPDTAGTLPGCSEYSGYITFRLKADQPNFEMHKTVSKEGENNFNETVTAQPGDVLDFKIEFKNTGTTILEPVSMKDILPEGLSYIEGSTYFWTSRHNSGDMVNDDLFNGNLNLGGFEAGDHAYVTYKVRVEDNTDLFPCGDTVVYNEGIVGTDNGSGHDKTEITVHRDCEETCVTNPELPGCQELPDTGPVEVAIATLIVGGIGGAGYYFYSTRKNLKTVQAGVMGSHQSGNAKPSHPTSEPHKTDTHHDSEHHQS